MGQAEVADGGANGTTSGALSVALASGASLPVMTADEVDYVTRNVELYQEHNGFSNVSDLVDLDNVLISELLLYRWGIWLAQTVDYHGKGFDEDALRRRVKEWSTELRQKKKQLGIDKMSRDKARGEGSLPHYISNLLYRAGVFGVMRNEQAAKAIELAMEAIAMVTWAYNVEPEEREEMRLTDADLVEWMRTVFMPRFMEIDAAFRATEQRYWVRDQ